MISRLAYAAVFVALAILGVYLITVAAHEGKDHPTPLVLSPSALFSGLQSCDVPGLRERVVGRGTRTVAYAGEFTPVTSTPWVVGKTRIFLYVVDGLGIVRIGNSQSRARAGDFFVIPQGVRHAVSASGGSLHAIYLEEQT